MYDDNIVEIIMTIGCSENKCLKKVNSLSVGKRGKYLFYSGVANINRSIFVA